MELYEYIAEQKQKDWNFKQLSFAKQLGINEGHLSAIARYRITPCPMLALDIEKATNGLVSGWELIIKSMERRGITKRKLKPLKVKDEKNV